MDAGTLGLTVYNHVAGFADADFQDFRFHSRRALSSVAVVACHEPAWQWLGPGVNQAGGLLIYAARFARRDK